MTDMVKTDRPGQLKEYLAAASQQLKAVLPRGVTVDRMIRTTMLAVAQNPDVLACTRESILMAVMECARLGFEPGGVLGHAYLVPYKNVCQFQLGYKGMIALATRGGHVQHVDARAVHEGDAFEYAYGTLEELIHRPMLGSTARPLLGTYAIARVGNRSPFHVCDLPELEAAKRRSKQPGRAWTTDFAAMGVKTAIRRLAKFLPMGDEERRAIAEDADREFGEPAPIENGDAAKNWREVLREQAERIRAAEATVVEDQRARADEAMQDEGGKT